MIEERFDVVPEPLNQPIYKKKDDHKLCLVQGYSGYDEH